MTPEPDQSPRDGLVWVNVIGLTLATGLLGAFFILYGNDFSRLFALLLGGGEWP